MNQPFHDRPPLDLRGVQKSFGPNQVLRGVDFHVMPGEIHALMGQNGCGKSTLMRIIDGLLKPDSGTVDVRGSVAMVHQELSLVPSLTIAENISLHAIPAQGGFLKRGRMRDLAREALARVGSRLSPDLLVEDISMAERQLVEIARVLQLDPAIMMLDEPTSSLSSTETRRLFDVLRKLAAEGTAIVYVSHRMDEVYDICTTATVLRDGALVARVSLAETPLDELIRMTIGRGLATRAEARNTFGATRLSVRGLGNARLTDISLNVRAGEIVGLAGLMGSGRTEIARAIFGLDRKQSGQVEIDGRAIDVRHPRDAIRAGIAYLPEDRAVEGLARDLDLLDNLGMASLPEHSPGGWVKQGELRAGADALIERLAVHPADRRYVSGALSGGNQQKVVLGKWLATSPKVFILDEPTRGVDIGAKTAIRDIVLQLAADGVAVLVISSELSELFDMADRLYIVRDGRIVGDMPRESFDEHRAIRMWSGVADDAAVAA